MARKIGNSSGVVEMSPAELQEHENNDSLIIPETVTSVQALTALHNAGFLAAVEAAMADPQTDKAAVIAFNRAVSFRRNSPFINSLAPALGLTESQIDVLFIAAAQID